MNPSQTFKVVLIGPGGSGKTTLLNRILIGEFEKKYLPTLGVEVHPLEFQTNYGQIILNIWDTAGLEQFAGLQDGYFVQSNGAIAFADSTDPNSYEKTEEFIQSYLEMCPDTPFIRVVNKVDISGGEIRPGYLPISAKSNYNFEVPFLRLIRKITNLDDLCFQANPAIQPSEVVLEDSEDLENGVKWKGEQGEQGKESDEEFEEEWDGESDEEIEKEDLKENPPEILQNQTENGHSKGGSPTRNI